MDSNNQLTLEQLIGQFQLFNSSLGKKTVTLEWHKFSLDNFVNFFGRERLPTEISKQTITDYRLHMLQDGYAAYSINSYLSSLKTFLNWLVEEEYLEKFPKIRFVMIDRYQPKESFNQEQFEEILEALTNAEKTPLLKTRLTAICLTLFDTGMRASELVSAKFADLEHPLIDSEECHILTITGAKRGGSRQVVLSPRTWAAIKDYRQELARPHGRGYNQVNTAPAWLFTSTKNLHEPLTVNGLRQIFNRLEKECENLPMRITPHVFRRAFATCWINDNEGQGLDTLLALGGWRDVATVKKHYAKYKMPTLIRAHKKLSPLSKSEFSQKVRNYEAS